jgi:hypothetical protein
VGFARGVTVTYLAAEKGRHDFGGQRMDVECHQVDTVQGAGFDQDSHGVGWREFNYKTPFEEPPVLLADIQSDYNEVLTEQAPLMGSKAFLSTVTQAITAKGASIALELSETYLSQDVLAEEVCVAAFSKGEAVFYDDEEVSCRINYTRHVKGAISIDDARAVAVRRIGKLLDASTVNGVASEVLEHVEDARTGAVSEKIEALDSLSVFESDAYVVATKSSRYETDGGWLRLQPINDSFMRLLVDEDQVQDEERSHGAESAGYIACDGPLFVTN